jgi:hypothetical protein
LLELSVVLQGASKLAARCRSHTLVTGGPDADADANVDARRGYLQATPLLPDGPCFP